MGWDIYVGNAVIAKRDKDDEQWLLTVERTEHPDAPEWPNPEGDPMVVGFGDISGKSNHRAPGYSGFADFCRDTGIEVTAFTEARGSDGDCFILRPDDLASVTKARRRWEAKHSGAVPGWRKGEDPTLAKLIWYEWWFTWALANCERPAVQMS